MFRLMICLVSLLCPIIAHADTSPPALPALYAVPYVDSDETLNVRSAPDAAAPIVGQLAHDADTLEVVQLSTQGGWAYISQGEQSGWVARRYLTPFAGETDGNGLPATLTCFGTEPFWTVSFTPEGLEVITPSDTQTYPITTLGFLPENAEISSFGYRFEWLDGDTPVRAHILPGLCSDGMSDARYGLHYVDTRMMNSGCCSL